MEQSFPTWCVILQVRKSLCSNIEIHVDKNIFMFFKPNRNYPIKTPYIKKILTFLTTQDKFLERESLRDRFYKFYE